MTMEWITQISDWLFENESAISALAGRSKDAQMALADFLGNWINQEFDAAGVQLD